MTSTCWTPKQGLVSRLTRLDACGAYVVGATGSVITDGFISVKGSAQMNSGTEFKQQLANGKFCVNEKDADTLQWIEVDLEFCGVLPSAFELISGAPAIADYAGNLIGFDVVENPTSNGFALELWTKITGAVPCAGSSPAPQFGYLLHPKLDNAIVGADYTIENNLVTFTAKAYSKPNPQWGLGPYNVQASDVSNTPGKLITTIGSAHRRTMLTTIAPPAASCGYTATT